jgi:hypothetical protein
MLRRMLGTEVQQGLTDLGWNLLIELRKVLPGDRPEIPDQQQHNNETHDPKSLAHGKPP